MVGLAIWGLLWFMPKYSYVQKNPGYCANLTEHLYYCGTEADLKQMFETTIDSKAAEDKIKQEAERRINEKVNEEISKQFAE